MSNSIGGIRRDVIAAAASVACLTVSGLAGLAHAAAIVPLSGLAGLSGFRIDGSAAGERSAYSISNAGDVNGDGIDDVILGACGPCAAGTIATDAGRSYVVFGRRTGFASPVVLGSLDGSTGFRIDGVAIDDRSGFAVAGGGDLDADGVDDLVIAAPRADPNGAQSGSVYVVFGRSAGFGATLALSTLAGSNGFRIDGVAAGDHAGGAVAFAGDLNGDGRDDLAIGARHADPNGDDSGSIYVVFGRATGGFAATLALSSLDGATGFRLAGVAAGDEAGAAVAAAGDLNGDGRADLVVGAPFTDPTADLGGASYVVFGRDTPFAAAVPLSSLDGTNGFRVAGAANNDRSGSSVSRAGDFNADGVDDLLVGAFAADPGGVNAAGSAFVVFGRSASGFPASIALEALDGSNGFRIDGAAAGDVAARAVAAGDINGDGIDDIALGADGADPGGSESGSTYVVFGRGGAFLPALNVATLSGSNGVRFDGVAAFDRSGAAVTHAGDVDDDGIDDLLIGAADADPLGPNSQAGSAYLVRGNAAPLRSAGGPVVLGSVLEDQGASVGVRIDAALAPRYLDVEPLRGAGFTMSTAAGGKWQYSLDAGANWLDIPAALSAASALVLGVDAQVRFAPAANFAGDSPAFAARMWDGVDGYAAGAGRDIGSSIGSIGGFSNDANLVSLVVSVMPVNDAPTFAASDPPTAVANGSEIVVPAWALFSAGPLGESTQAVAAYLVGGVSNAALFTQQPTVDAAGVLRYTPVSGATGTSSFAVRVRDDGGTANGGVDTSAQQSFTITLGAAPDPMFADGFE